MQIQTWGWGEVEIREGFSKEMVNDLGLERYPFM